MTQTTLASNSENKNVKMMYIILKFENSPSLSEIVNKIKNVTTKLEITYDGILF